MIHESPEAQCCGHVEAVHEPVVIHEFGTTRFALDFFDEMPDELARAWREGRVFVWCGVCEDTCGVALPEETPHA